MLDNVIWSVQTGARGLFPLLSSLSPGLEPVRARDSNKWWSDLTVVCISVRTNCQLSEFRNFNLLLHQNINIEKTSVNAYQNLNFPVYCIPIWRVAVLSYSYTITTLYYRKRWATKIDISHAGARVRWRVIAEIFSEILIVTFLFVSIAFLRVY